MSLSTLSLLDGTTITATGGTAIAFTPDGTAVVNGISLVDTTATTVSARSQFVFTNKSPIYNSKMGTYGKHKQTIKHTVPGVDATTGEVYFSTVWVDISTDPRITYAEKTKILYRIAQSLFDADTADFRQYGSLA